MRLILGLLFLSCHYFCNAQILIIDGNSISISEGVEKLYYDVMNQKYDSLWKPVITDGNLEARLVLTKVQFESQNDSTIIVNWIDTETGKIFQQGTFCNGLACGKFTRSYGEQINSTYFDFGRKNGAQIEIIGIHKLITYYQNGQRNGARYGLIISNGIIDFIQHYKNGLLHGTSEYYWATESGEVSLKHSHEYKNGSPVDGTYTYYNQGLVWIKGQYKNGVKHGWETTYDGYGQVVKRMLYKGGKVTRHKKFEREYDIDQ